jgi:hypothetical protein
MDVPKSSSSG